MAVPHNAAEEESDSALSYGVLALLEAKPGREAEVAAFLRVGQSTVEHSGAWHAVRFTTSTFGVFDSSANGQAGLSGQLARALQQVGPDLLAKEPDIRLVDLIAVKPAA